MLESKDFFDTPSPDAEELAERADWDVTLADGLIFSCCFCGKGMEEIELALYVWPGGGDDGSGGQQYWAHKDCFVSKLTEDARTGPIGGSGDE